MLPQNEMKGGCKCDHLSLCPREDEASLVLLKLPQLSELLLILQASQGYDKNVLSMTKKKLFVFPWRVSQESITLD